ncbi:MAG: hypothetical protein ACTHJQ_22285 [Rhizobiaceae bacterium]
MPDTQTQHREISFSFLAERIGRERAEIIWRHLAPEALGDDAKTATCYAVNEARKRFSSKAVAQGLRLFAADRGKVLDTPAAMMSLETLVNMLAEARSRRSIVDMLAASEELPVAPQLTVETGRRSAMPDLEAFGMSSHEEPTQQSYRMG